MFNKDNIIKIEYTQTIGSTYKVEMIALYNKTKVTEKEVLKAIELESIAENENVIFMTSKQFNNVFTD
jgi:hypothetical protein